MVFGILWIGVEVNAQNLGWIMLSQQSAQRSTLAASALIAMTMSLSVLCVRYKQLTA